MRANDEGWLGIRGRLIVVLAAVSGAVLGAAGLWPAALLDEKSGDLERAARLFKEQNWAEARQAYDAVRDAADDWRSVQVRTAVQGSVQCSLNLAQWDDALRRAEQFVTKTAGSLEEAIGERFLGGLYMRVPHQGTKRAGSYLRGQWTQGVQVSSFKRDRREAIRHLERARQLLMELASAPDRDEGADPEAQRTIELERIGVDFDLTAVLAQQGPQYGYGGSYGNWRCAWWWNWGVEAEEDSSAVDDADYEEPRGWYPDYDAQTPPTGIPVGPDGEPVFIGVPDSYSPVLGDGAKIRFLLEEVRRLDTSEEKHEAANALYRWGTIARSLYGPETFRQWNAAQVQYDATGRPLPKAVELEPPQKQIWELADDEALTFVGGRLRVVKLPPDENPLVIWRRVEELYPQSRSACEAAYSRGLYLQSRQQFPQAIAQYQATIETYPKGSWVGAAQHQIHLIRQQAILFGTSGIHLPGERPQLTFTYRNTGKVEFVAREVDLLKYVRDGLEKESDDYWQYRNLSWGFFNNQHWEKYVGKERARWSEQVPLLDDLRTAESQTALPLTGAGAYVVEGRTADESAVSRVLVLVTDIAIVQKNLQGKGLIWLVDARTGRPLPGQAVRIYEHWADYKNGSNRHKWKSTVRTTDQNGAIEYSRSAENGWSNVDAVVAGADNRMSISFFQGWNENGGQEYWESGQRSYVITDRPVYRPGDTVHYRVWMRLAQNRLISSPQRNSEVTITIFDAKGNSISGKQLRTDAFGGVSGEFVVGQEPPLGVYQIRVNGHPVDNNRVGGGFFRVEEYRKPEFEVTVRPAADHARLGEKVRAEISARYYFGAPVSEGTVSYKVFREDYYHVYWGPGEYDWLYGPGYGRYIYPYPWFPWWGRWGCYLYFPWHPHYGPYYHQYWGGFGGEPADWRRRIESGTRRALRELVASGTAALKFDGTFEIEIDTSGAARELPDRDHRYTVEAEVRDASRRTIEGQGSIVVTRQAFYAFVDVDHGWYRPQSDAQVEIRALTSDDVPVATPGEVVISRVRYGGAGNREVREEELRRFDVATDERGRYSFRLPLPGEGQYRITFSAADSWGQEVQGNALLWVAGPDFDGRVYRFNDLEIIADKRTYAPGDTAHLLVNTASEGAQLLFSSHVVGGTLLNHRFIDIPARSTVVDVPIGESSVPNFFIEGTLVRDGRLHTESQQLFVPPSEKLLHVVLETDKPDYRPGDKGKIRVSAVDANGEPVAGQVTLTAYDQAVTYIQDEFGPDPRTFFYGRPRQSWTYVESSVNQFFHVFGGMSEPDQVLWAPGMPDGWNGYWALGGEGLFAQNEARQAGVGGGGRDSADRLQREVNTGVPVGSQPMDQAYGLAMKEGDAKSRAFAPPSSNERMTGDVLVVEPELRMNFADTALWLPAVKLGKDGTAEVEIEFPQSLTTWRVRGYAITSDSKVGDASTSAVTDKDLLVRLQAPRFFVERDEVVLSANVHNYLDSAKEVTAELLLPKELFSSLDRNDYTTNGHSPAVEETDGRGGAVLKLLSRATVDANGEHRFDWPVRVKKAGLARVTVRALTDAESDAMQLAFPVLVHGTNKTVAQGGSYRVTDEGERVLHVDLPQDIDPEQTQLEITLAPSLAGVMIDALPYLIGYPYGCVEQTMSRFYPSVLVRHVLQKAGTNLEAIRAQRAQMSPDDVRHRFGYADSPVFDSAELERMVRAGLLRLYNFQQSDGGWGWWKEDESSPYQTAYVLQGLHAARQADVQVDDGVYQRGLQYLQSWVQGELARPKEDRQLGHVQTQAYVAYVLSLDARLQEDDLHKWLDELFEQRGDQNNYGRALLALTLHNQQQTERAQLVLRNLLQFVERDDSNETAWVRTPGQYWWFWWNNDIETNAWALKALVTLDPQSELAPRLVKWLLNNRRNGYYWRSTRDTALTVAAMTDYMVASGEASPDYTLSIEIDGRPTKQVHVKPENMFTFDHRLVLYGLQIEPGPHDVTISKQGPGALYYSCYLSYFTKEEDVKGAGNEIYIVRDYYKLVPKVELVGQPDPGAAHTPPANRPVPLSQTGHREQRATWERVLLKTGDRVDSGDMIEVVLSIESKNTYDFLAFEDMKPAGCEPVELRSGGRWAGGLCANVELRDEKVVFFIGLLDQGHHMLRYRLRAETPGEFHALPTTGYAMYAPEIRAISDEMRLKIRD